MTPPLRALVKVEDLLGHPERVATLDPAEAQRLSIQLSALLVALTLRASEPQITREAENKDPATWLSADQVEQRFGLNHTWLMEHRRLLASLGIVSRPSRKLRVYDAKRLHRYLDSRRASGEPPDFQIAKRP